MDTLMRVCVLLLAGVGGLATEIYLQGENRIVVGAIRWDAWHGDRSEVGKAVERCLSPKQWHGRLPFFAEILGEDAARIDGASQPVMDREIRYAQMAHLDYWAFVLYDERNPMSLGLNYYLSSTRKDGLRFCVIVELGHWTTAESAAKEFERVAELTSRPEYQKVVGGRPLLYVIDNERTGPIAKAAWGVRQPRVALNQLRTLVRSKGGGDPYMVIQDWRPERASALRVEANADAMSSYSYQRDGKNAAYSQLALEAEQFWDECRRTGSSVVPIVMTGWDRRPRVERPVFWETWQRPNVGIEKFYREPTAAELSQHVRLALAWVRTHPDAAATKAILIYAWNENDEGGWLVPTLKEGDWRVQAVKSALQNDR
jgi:hypothetical protein